MKSKILLSTSLLAVTFLANAQDAAKTYAITGKTNNPYFWADIKQVDINTGKVVKTLFEANITKFKTTNLDVENSIINSPNQNPTLYGVAACALDTKHNRLYFAPIHISDIRYLDLNKTDAEFTIIKSNVIANTNKSAAYQSEENQLSRMVIAADGYGYALSNDANHFIRFNIGKKNGVEDLGMLIDGDNNNGVSIHNKCTSWGGDMVADAFGKLLMISANHSVFEINIDTKIANYKGIITGLPTNYSTNGAAVDDNGKLVVSSANVFDALYTVDMVSLKATKVESKETPFNASDLANGNMLFQKEANAANQNGIVAIKPIVTENNSDAHIFPNPVTDNQFKVLFNNELAGKYLVTMSDLSGKNVMTKNISIDNKNNTATVQIANGTAKGIYFVKVSNQQGNIIFTDKIIVQ